MSIRSKAFAVGLLMFCFGATSPAEELPSRGPIPFAAYDKDGNGMISETEFNTVRGERMSQRATEGRPMRNAGKGPAFSDFDRNGDGHLSRDELATGQSSQMGRGRAMGPGAGMRPGSNMPAFSDFDLNGDDSITEQEFYGARGKRMAERAQQGYPMRNAVNAPSFEDVDTDGDGKISAEEFAAHQQQHQQIKKQ